MSETLQNRPRVTTSGTALQRTSISHSDVMFPDLLLRRDRFIPLF